MAITGIRRLTFLVDDFAAAAGFFDDYGLNLVERDETSARFETGNGAEALLLLRGHPHLPADSAPAEDEATAQAAE